MRIFREIFYNSSNFKGERSVIKISRIDEDILAYRVFTLKMGLSCTFGNDYGKSRIQGSGRMACEQIERKYIKKSRVSEIYTRFPFVAVFAGKNCIRSKDAQTREGFYFRKFLKRRPHNRSNPGALHSPLSAFIDIQGNPIS